MRKEKLEEIKAYIEQLKVKDKKLLNEPGFFLRSEVYNCYLNNGEVIKREKLIKGGSDGSAVIVLPLTTDNKVILTVEPRVFTRLTVGIGIPSGYVEKGETKIKAALRELKEETGYVPSKIIDLGGFYQDMGCSSAYNNSYLAINCIKTSTQHLDDGEYIKYFECTFDEALELIDLNYIEGCNAIITLNRAKKYVKENKYGI